MKVRAHSNRPAPRRPGLVASAALLCATLWLPSFAAAQAGRLNDTGDSKCYVGRAAGAVANAADLGSHPRQDCRYGRDAAATDMALTRTGSGTEGFDFTRVCNNGQLAGAGGCPASPTLGALATDWACTKDNVTGLVWEVKVNSSTHLRHMGHTYTWSSSNAATNGGDAGATGSDTCNTTLPGGTCNTDAYITAVNTAQLCGFNDWRLPTASELQSLVRYGAPPPSIDTTQFPNTASSAHWSASTYAALPAYAWAVVYAGGVMSANPKSSGIYVRLVRGQ